MSLDAYVGQSEQFTPLDVRAGVRDRHAPRLTLARPLARPGASGWLVARLAFSVLSAAAVGVLVAAPHLLSVAVLAAWIVLVANTVRPVLRPRFPDRATVHRAVVMPFALVALGVGLAGIDDRALAQSLVLLLTATATLWLSSAAAARWGAPIRVVVVGDRAALGQAATTWARRPGMILVGAAMVGAEPGGSARDRETSSVPMVRGCRDIARHVARWGAQAVIVVPCPQLTPLDVQRLSWALEGTGAALAVRHVVDSVAPHRLSVVSLAGSTFTRIGSSRPTVVVRVVKATLDRVLGVALLVLALPVLVALVLLVRLDSPGPGIFRQRRIGRGGRPFTLYKIRSMHADAEGCREALVASQPGDGLLFKMREDPRSTRIGRVLRRLSLDELPQLLNVVRGEMSLVGPRPALPEEVSRYDWQALRRLTVRPGMTGLWQVSGRADLDWARSLELDVRYIDNVTLVDDLLLCLRTVRAVLGGRGAY